jgi:acyl carrier protein
MVPVTEIAAEIERYIREELAPDIAGAGLGADESLLDSGILDSFGILSLIEFVKQRFCVEIPLKDIEPANFETIGAVARTVRSYLEK